MRILLVGGGAREHAIGEALCRSKKNIELIVISHNHNPGLDELSTKFILHDELDIKGIIKHIEDLSIDFAVIGLEGPLEAGLPDALNKIGISCVGPNQMAARLETSKLFTRNLLKKYDIPGQVEYHYFDNVNSLENFLLSTDKDYALKPVGLTAGKGVKIMGEHLKTIAEAIEYGKTVITDKIGGFSGIVVEERLTGEEFTLQAFVDGENVIPMPLVQDYKRAYDGDKGPNTGSMGSYSQPDGLLPFVTKKQKANALEILKQIVQAMEEEGSPYKGIIYGQFMMTAKGAKLIEINARFGDPEAINVLPLLKNDFADICLAIIKGKLSSMKISFSNKATVCRYIVPPGYPEKPRADVPLSLEKSNIESLGVKIFFAKVNAKNGVCLTTSSRAIALVGISDSVSSAADAVEKALSFVHGDYHVRRDIGKRHAEQCLADRKKLSY
ncbi:MAG: phosphoribosylamine--glycine ligase [Actinobacteria bacterium]|nr:phosphoribosylamine--glycine ligase [Actinomycetota bacterium]